MNVQSVTARKTAGSRKTPWLAWFTWALTAVLITANVLFGYLNDPSTNLGNAFYALVLFAFATVGALIGSRRPENLIGWLVAAGTFLISLGGLALEYAVYALITAPHSFQGGEWMLWFGAWVRSLGFFTLVVFVPLLFPNGRLPSPRWRTAGRFAFGGVALFTVLNMLAPTNQTELRLPPLPNPLSITIPPDLYGPLNGISFLSISIVTLIVAACVVIRFRRAEGEERQQLKWFAYAGVLAAFVFAIIIFGVFLLPEAVMTKIGGVLFSLLLAGFPLAIGVAILRYRLYEIDLLINRTLVYVPLTAILAGIFAASIALTQKLFVALTGQSSDAATVLTTLIVVAAVEPLKSGLQHLVDRRFKEAPDPAKKLRALREQARAVIQVMDMEQSTRRLLEDALAAFDARGGAIYLGRDGESRLVHTAGDWNGEAKLSVPLEHPTNGNRFGVLLLGARRSGADYTPQDRQTLLQTVNVIAEAIALSERADGVRK